MFAAMTNYLIIEFIPKEDEKVKLMLRYKTDIYKKYNTTNIIDPLYLYYSLK